MVWMGRWRRSCQLGGNKWKTLKKIRWSRWSDGDDDDGRMTKWTPCDQGPGITRDVLRRLLQFWGKNACICQYQLMSISEIKCLENIGENLITDIPEYIRKIFIWIHPRCVWRFCLFSHQRPLIRWDMKITNLTSLNTLFNSSLVRHVTLLQLLLYS